MYIFGYGSLINAKSIGGTLKREVLYKEMIPAVIDAYSRSLSAGVYVNLTNNGVSRKVKGVFFDLTKSEKCCNGILLKVNEKELEYLKAREFGYDLISVVAKTESEIIDAYTFKVRDENKTSNGYILSKYIQIVEEGLSNFSETFRDSFWEQTLSSNMEELPGDYEWHCG